MQTESPINLPKPLPVWPGGQVPLGSDADTDLPRFTLYLPSEEWRTGASVLILPGGGYGMLSTAKEGHRPAQYLCAHGIAAAVLEYRHAPQRHPVPLMDAQRGLRILRSCAESDGLDPARVGVMGFSAGGHLAGCLATQPEVAEGRVEDARDAVSFRPDFAALIYPVVSLVEDYAHLGSRDNLLGVPADPSQAALLSVEKAVGPETCPMFLFHTQEDAGVPVQNSLALAEALTRHGVNAELHVWAAGAHGIGMGENHPWCRALVDWLPTG